MEALGPLLPLLLDSLQYLLDGIQAGTAEGFPAYGAGSILGA